MASDHANVNDFCLDAKLARQCLVLKALWMSLCVVMIGYYASGILLLGNTPWVLCVRPVAVQRVG